MLKQSISEELPFRNQDMLTNNRADLTCNVCNCFPLEGTRFYFDYIKKMRIKVIVLSHQQFDITVCPSL